jgi:hypothetical protein
MMMESNAVSECGVTMPQAGVDASGTKNKTNKSSCRLSWLLKEKTVRWTSEIRGIKVKKIVYSEGVRERGLVGWKWL